MKRFTIIIALLLAAATGLQAQEDPAVRIDTIQYAIHSDYPLHLYLARPLNEKDENAPVGRQDNGSVRQGLPCIIYVPGSAWKKQRMERSLHSVIKMAKMGYAAASVEYRPCNVALFPAQVADAKTATRYLREHAAELGLDSRNFFAWGSSSGGHTVLLQAFTQDSALLDVDSSYPGSNPAAGNTSTTASSSYPGSTQTASSYPGSNPAAGNTSTTASSSYPGATTATGSDTPSATTAASSDYPGATTATGSSTPSAATATASTSATGSTTAANGSPTSCKVNAVVDYYGPSELVHEFQIQDSYDDPAREHGLLLGDPLHEKRDVALKASPLYYVHPYVVPVFIVHGDADKVVPLEQTLWLEERLKECGASYECVILEGQKHGGPAFWAPELLDRIDAFLKSNMVK